MVPPPKKKNTVTIADTFWAAHLLTANTHEHTHARARVSLAKTLVYLKLDEPF